MIQYIHQFLNTNNIYIHRYPNHDVRRRMQIMSIYEINKVFDVGASSGIYGSSIRNLNYTKKIISFEPMKVPFMELERKTRNDDLWIANNYGLGDEETELLINISENSYSSSILNILPIHLQAAPDSKYKGTEQIKINKMDTIFETFAEPKDNLMLKIDTQGYEKRVLVGAKNCLSNFRILQVEMSLTPIYEDEILFPEMIQYLAENNFSLISLETGTTNPDTAQLLQVDGIFVNNKFLK